VLMSDVHPLLAGFRVVTTIPIIWGDQDAFGHVNNLTYLRWCETSRVEYLQRVALWVELPPTGIGPILASLKCDYKMQLTHPGTVLVGTRVTRIGNSSIRMEHRVLSQEEAVVAAEVDSTLVWYDYQRLKAVPVPAEARQIISQLEGKSFEKVHTSVIAR
jgi:acyl-CoA thioester hydrolase